METRVLEASARESPSPALSARMAEALGIAFPAAPPATTPPGGNAGSGRAMAVGRATSWGPWIVSGGLALVVGAGVLGARSARTPSPARSASPDVSAQAMAPVSSRNAPASVSGSASTTAAPSVAPAPPLEVAAKPVRKRAERGRARASLAEQLALIDGARALLGEGASDRALGLLDRYRLTFPAGVFQPEAAALRVESLVAQRRYREARALVAQFPKVFGGGPLADRVAELGARIPRDAR